MADTNPIRELLAAEPGLTITAFAERAGVAEKTVRNAMKGRSLHRSTRRLIAQALGLPEEKIFPPSV